jgi:iron complex transport system substrate-binding protein
MQDPHSGTAGRTATATRPGNKVAVPPASSFTPPARRLACLLVLLALIQPVLAVNVIDDSRREVHLAAPAQRIVSLAPNITELLFAAGAGDRIVGTVRFSDYPVAAQDIPRVGDTYNLDMEAILALKPDLIILWRSGMREALIETVERSGYPVYESEPASLQGIAATIEDFGRLAGTETAAVEAGARFNQRLASLRQHYAGRTPVRVFYQFWNRPIFTVNGKHLISRVIQLCGGSNVFAGLSSLTPQVNTESVLAAEPEVIIASGIGDAPPSWLDDWRHWPELQAVRDGHVYAIPPELLLRATPRILDGAEMMCKFIDQARH